MAVSCVLLSVWDIVYVICILGMVVEATETCRRMLIYNKAYYNSVYLFVCCLLFKI